LPTSPPGSLHGARHPRVEVAPAGIVDDLGAEAIELAALAGLVLDFWQQQGLVLMLSIKGNGLWACFEYAELVARQNGKGGILEARALAGLFLLGERLIMWSAHEYKTAMEAFRRLKVLLGRLGTPINDTLIDYDGVLLKITNTNGEEAIERLDTGARIKFIARSKGSGRGFTGDCNIIDEAYAYTPDQHAALLPTMNAVRNPQIIYMSSPPLDEFSGEVLFDLRERAEAGGDPSLGYRDWGVAGDLDHLDDIDLDDHELWAQANPALGIRITIEALARLRRSMRSRGGRDFAREILGVWPRRQQGGGIIDVAKWAALVDEDSRRVGGVVLAVDIAPTGDYAAIALYGLRADGLGHLQLVDYRPGTHWIVGRMVELGEVLGEDLIVFVAGRATGGRLKADLAKAGIDTAGGEQPNRGELVIVSGTEMGAGCGQIIDLVNQNGLRHLGQGELDASVAGARIRENEQSIAWSRKTSEADTSPVVAGTLAQWAHRTYAHLVADDDYDLLDSIG
jgi:hypothetical protein